MGVHCKIVLDNDTVYAGGILSGQVIYKFDSPKTLRKIELHLNGRARLRHSQRQSTFFSSEEFFKDEIIIHGEDENPTEVEAGSYSYPFNYIIPLNSPSSYNYYDSERSTTSYIKYFIKIERPSTLWAHNDAEEEFFVVKYIDLNFTPQIRDAAEISASKNKFYFCFSSRPFFVKLQLEKQGFVTGSEIPFTFECNNQSSYSANDIIVSLRLIITYYRVMPNEPGGRIKLDMKPSNLLLSECSLGPVKPQEGKMWNKNLKIPEIQPFNSDGCKVIDFDYILCFTVKFPFPHRKLSEKIFITVGNVPITDKQLPDYGATMQQPVVEPFNFKTVKDLKDLKKYIIKQDLNSE